MARVLAEGTGAAWSQVWLVVRRPPDACGDLATGRDPVPATGPDATAG